MPQLTVPQLEKVYEAERHQTGRGPAFPLAMRVIRQRVMPNESKQQARERWRREEQLEDDRALEGRRVCTGQVLPVHYDDE